MEVITRAVLMFCFRMQNNWLEYSQLYAGYSMYQMSQPGNMVMQRMPVFPWFTKQIREKIKFLIVTLTSSRKTNAEIVCLITKS